MSTPFSVNGFYSRSPFSDQYIPALPSRNHIYLFCSLRYSDATQTRGTLSVTLAAKYRQAFNFPDVFSMHNWTISEGFAETPVLDNRLEPSKWHVRSLRASIFGGMYTQ